MLPTALSETPCPHQRWTPDGVYEIEYPIRGVRIEQLRLNRFLWGGFHPFNREAAKPVVGGKASIILKTKLVFQ